MKKIERVSLIGLGALGSAYLGKMAESVPIERLRVIASGQRAERYRENGVKINGKTNRFPVCEPGDAVEPADLLIFAVKYHQLAQAIEDARGHVGPDTIVLSLLNGITSERELSAAYGGEKVLYALALGIDATRVGDETVSSTLGHIPFGEAENPPGGLSPRVRRVEAFFQRAGIPYDIPEDMVRSLWNKFMINVGANQLSALLGAPYVAFHRLEEVRALALSAMLEVVAVARAEGVGLTEQDARAVFPILEGLAPTGKTSMLQDMEAGRKTEVEIFGGTVAQLGEKHGIPVPVNQMLLQLIHAREAVSHLLHTQL